MLQHDHSCPLVLNTYKAKDVPGDMETILSLVGQACLLHQIYFFPQSFLLWFKLNYLFYPLI